MSHSEATVIPVDELTLSDEFSALMEILILCATFNSKGAPILSSGPSDISTPPLAHSQQPHRIALNAVASLLVRDREIIAVGCPFPRSQKDKSSESPFRIFATQDTRGVTPDEQTIPLQDLHLSSDTDAASTRDDSTYFKHDDTENIRVLKPGFSQWENIRKGWDYIFKNISAIQSVSLNDHISTLSSFLDEFRTLPVDDPTSRMHAFHHFSMYLIVRSWPKLNRRMNHHQLSTGLRDSFTCFSVRIPSDGDYEENNMILKFLNQPDLQLASSSQHGDALANTLSSMDSWEWLCNHDLLGCRFDSDHDLAKLTNLLQAAQKDRMIYSPETAKEFHYLLGNSVELYSKQLWVLNRGYERDRKFYREFFITAYLLWRISVSSFAEDHFKYLAWRHAFWYQSFDETYYRNIKPGDGFDIYTDDHDDDLTYIIRRTARDSLVKRWLECITIPFSSLSYLTSFVSRRRDKIELRLIAINNSSLPKSVRWADVLKRALKRAGDQSIDPSRAEEAVALATQTRNPSLEFRKLLNAVFPAKKISCESDGKDTDRKALEIRDEVLIKGSIHGEAALACMSAFYDRLNKPVDELKNFNLEGIGLSRLCCPVCWELLKIAAGTDPDDENASHRGGFRARGHHMALSFVRLPAWVPPETVDALLFKFSQKLCSEVDKMIRTKPEINYY